MINYRYHILKKLGEGGSGEVFLVEDVLKQRRQSAMKVLYGGTQPDRVADEQFKNEVSVLSTLQHPNLVRVSDLGTIRHCDDASLAGRQFLTMEYIQGSTALEWWRQCRTRPDGLLYLKHIVLQTLGVLSYVHRLGVIHFDIKPENLLVLSSDAQDEYPLLKLTDFGFSTRHDAALEFPLRGTLEYTAPELLKREIFDQRVDLYSLGATIFHLIEDRCPFEADTPVQLIKKVLTAEPAFQRSTPEDYSPLLHLATNLLQKDPAQRYRTAAEAARAFLEEDHGLSAPAFNRLFKPGFVGREKEKELLGSAIASLLDPDAGSLDVVIKVEGPEGIGKTALLNEMARVARVSDVAVFDVTTMLRDLPFSAILSLLPLLRAEGMSRSDGGFEPGERYAHVIEDGSGVEAVHSKQVRLDWMKERDRVVEAQARFINQVSVLFPLMLIVDDAHLLDPESEEVLRIASRDARPGRLLILTAVRGEHESKVSGRRVQLEELDARCVSAMSSSLLWPVEVSEALASRLFQLYGGSPALIVEALRSASALVPSHGPTQSADTQGIVEDVLRQLPRELENFLFLRYRALDRGKQLTLEFLSCIAFPASVELLQAVLPFQPQRTTAYLTVLEAEGLAYSHEYGNLYSIRHGKLKALVSSALGQSRKESHLFIASTMEKVSGNRTFSELLELAYQWREAGNCRASSSCLEAAGDEGMRMGAYRQAKELFLESAALAKGSAGPDPGHLDTKVAHCYLKCGDFREAVELAEMQLEKASLETTRQVELHKTAGIAHSRLGHYEESKHHIQSALRSSEDVAESVELRQELVGIDIALGNFADAERASIEQLGRAKGLGNPGITASVYTDLGIAAFFQDKFDQSAEYFEKARRIYEATAQHMRLADALMNIANAMSAKGNTVKAVEYWTNALETSRDYGTLHQQAQIQNNLGIAHFRMKRYREARDFLEAAGAIFTRLDSRQGSAYVLTNLGEVDLGEGQYEQALTVWEDAERLYREMDDGQGIVESLLQIAQVQLVLGSSASGGTYLDQAEAVMGERKLEAFRSQLLFLRGMQMMDLCRYDAARDQFAQSEQSSHEGTESERRLLLRLRLAESEYRMGSHGQAVTLAREALDCGERTGQRQVVAWASYLLGTIATASPVSVPETALQHFRAGFEAIASEPVTEATWKLSLALGKEFQERGQRIKAREYFRRARLVLRFFLAQFRSSRLRNSYLGAENRQKALAFLDSTLTT